MSFQLACDFDQLNDPSPRLLSRIYHQESKLSPYKLLEFQEQVVAHNEQFDPGQQDPAVESRTARRAVALPAPSRRLGKGRLHDVLRTRRTRRGEFSPCPVSLRQWGHLLGSACGITGQLRHPDAPEVVHSLRAWPSAGSLYPLDVYMAPLLAGELEKAWFRYDATAHRLCQIGACCDDETLKRLVYAEGLWENASGALVLTATFAKTQAKYGERGYRFVLLDAGHLAQNILLVCEDLGLAAVPLGGFDDDGLAAELQLDPEKESPLYVILIGSRRK